MLLKNNHNKQYLSNWLYKINLKRQKNSLNAILFNIKQLFPTLNLPRKVDLPLISQNKNMDIIDIKVPNFPK